MENDLARFTDAEKAVFNDRNNRINNLFLGAKNLHTMLNAFKTNTPLGPTSRDDLDTIIFACKAMVNTEMLLQNANGPPGTPTEPSVDAAVA